MKKGTKILVVVLAMPALVVGDGDSNICAVRRIAPDDPDLSDQRQTS